MRRDEARWRAAALGLATLVVTSCADGDLSPPTLVLLNGETQRLNAYDLSGDEIRKQAVIAGNEELNSVRRIRFADGAPLPPETIDAGLSFPDGFAVLEDVLEP